MEEGAADSHLLSLLKDLNHQCTLKTVLKADLVFIHSIEDDDVQWAKVLQELLRTGFLSKRLFHFAESYKGSRRQCSERPSVQMWKQRKEEARPQAKDQGRQRHLWVKRGQARWEGSLRTPSATRRR